MLQRQILSRALTAGLLLAAALSPARALASGLNIEKLRIGPPKDGVSANVDLSLAYGQGNVNTFDFGTDGSVAFRHHRHLVFLLGSSEFSTRARNEDGEGVGQLLDKSNIFIDRHFAHLRYNYQIFEWLNAEVFTQLQSNEFLLVQIRTKHGAGPRFTAFSNKDFGVHFGVAYMFDHEQLDEDRLLVAPRGQALSFAHRMSSYATLSLDIDRFAAQTTTYAQPRWDNWSDVQLLHETQFSVDVTEHFALKFNVNLRWDSVPPTYCAEEFDQPSDCVLDDVVKVKNYDLSFGNSFSFSF